MLTPRDAEQWGVRVLDAISLGKFQEDALVELKAAWIEPEKAAKRIAAHANAARGNDILWVFGVDEKRGVVGISPNDLATWLPQTKSWFDGAFPPTVDVSFVFNQMHCVALVFDTQFAPYQVKNSKNSIIEVPWREGTSVRSARRDELLRLLIPFQKSPDVELLKSSIKLAEQKEQRSEGKKLAYVSFTFYIIPINQMPIVIPKHRITAELRVEGQESALQMTDLYFSNQQNSARWHANMMRSLSKNPATVVDVRREEPFESSVSELILRKAMSVDCLAKAYIPNEIWEKATEFDVSVKFLVGAERSSLVLQFKIAKKSF